MLSAQQFGLLSNAPLIRPIHPGPLNIPASTTAAMTTVLKERHADDLKSFKEVTGVEAALKQQLVQAIQPEYLSAVRNRITNAIQIPLSDVLQHLKTTTASYHHKCLMMPILNYTKWNTV
jgi:hypothetical protein